MLKKMLSIIIGIVFFYVFLCNNPIFAIHTTMHAVEITYPFNYKYVSIGTPITIEGRSLDGSASDCRVLVRGHNMENYEPAVATGFNGINDYSTWQFTFTPQYGGINTVIAKFTCLNDPILDSYYYLYIAVGLGPEPMPGDSGREPGDVSGGDPTGASGGEPEGDPTGASGGEPEGDPSDDPTGGEPEGDPSDDPTGGEPEGDPGDDSTGGEPEGDPGGDSNGDDGDDGSQGEE